MNLGDHRTALLDELSKTSSDTFHTTAILNRFINRALGFVANSKNWQQTQRAEKQTIALAGDETDEYWDYPENFKTDSIYRIAVGDGTPANDKRYTLLIWDEYLNHKEDNPTSDKVAADHRRQVFIYPILTTDASVITFWGHEIPTALASDSDTHPFAGEQQLEEAINRYALGLALKKMRGSYVAQGEKALAEAAAFINAAWAEQRQRQASRRTQDSEAWAHTDFLNQSAGNRVTKRGSFNLDS